MSNLLTPMNRNTIYRSDHRDDEFRVATVTRSFYDRLLTKDPQTIYILTDTNEVYRGDIPFDTSIKSLNKNGKYLYVKNTPAGFEYVISEKIGNRMMDVCSYLDPNAALEYLRNQNSKPNFSEQIHYIRKILNNARVKNIDRHNAVDMIIGIIEILFRVQNKPAPTADIRDLLYRFPYAKFPPRICDFNNSDHVYIKKNSTYRVYSYIWDFLFISNDFDKRTFDSDAEETKWIEDLSGVLFYKTFLDLMVSQ